MITAGACHRIQGDVAERETFGLAEAEAVEVTLWVPEEASLVVGLAGLRDLVSTECEDAVAAPAVNEDQYRANEI